MRITAEILQKIGEDTIARRVRRDTDVMAAFIHGAALSEDPVLGGTADIDLFFVHVNPPAQEREIERLTDDVHLDITHQERRFYSSPRQIRLDPWLGPVVNGCKIVYDPRHFLDFIQAGVRGQFDHPENVLARARLLANRSRQAWLGFQLQPPAADPTGFSAYLDAVSDAVNAVAVLEGSLLTERRFLIDFAERAASVERPGLHAGALGLLGGPQADQGRVQGLLPEWGADFKALPESQRPIHLHLDRYFYYYNFFEEFAAGEAYPSILWPLLRTWTDMALANPAHASWEAALTGLGLWGEQFSQRLDALDAYLDTIEVLLEQWAARWGI